MAVDTIEKVIYYLLANDGNVSGLVGTRIYPSIIPQGASIPAIVYEQLTGPREHTMSGALGMASPNFNINCWASTYGGARTLADYVRILLDGYSGTVGSRKVWVMMLNDESDLFEQTPDIRGTRKYGKQLSFAIWFREDTS